MIDFSRFSIDLRFDRCPGMSLLAAAEHVQRCRGTILSNHGFRLQLVRLALQLGRLGEPRNIRSTPRRPIAPHAEDYKFSEFRWIIVQ